MVLIHKPKLVLQATHITKLCRNEVMSTKYGIFNQKYFQEGKQNGFLFILVTLFFTQKCKSQGGDYK